MWVAIKYERTSNSKVIYGLYGWFSFHVYSTDITLTPKRLWHVHTPHTQLNGTITRVVPHIDLFIKYGMSELCRTGVKCAADFNRPKYWN